MTEEEKKTITQEKHPGYVAQGHKLAALMKMTKEEILRDKKQPSEQSTVQYSVQSIVQPTVQSTVQSNEAYIYIVGTFAVLAICFCVFFVYKTSQTANKKQVNEKQDQSPKRRHMF